MADIQRYLDGIESQHQSAPKFMATATVLLEKVDGAHQLMKDMPAYFNVNDAVGNQQDILGERVGTDRRHSVMDIPGAAELLDDESFRRVLLTKVVQNQWNGTGKKFLEIWETAFGSTIEATWYDNQDMSMDVYLVGDIPLDLVRMIQRGYYIPRPMGVGMSITVVVREYTGAAKAWMATEHFGYAGALQATAINSDMGG